MQYREFNVAVPKCYFPKEKWPSNLRKIRCKDRFFAIYKTVSTDPFNAAISVWKKYSSILLPDMISKSSNIRRISLVVLGDNEIVIEVYQD